MKKILIASALAGVALTMTACGKTPDNSEVATDAAVGDDSYAPDDSAPFNSEDATATGAPAVTPSDVQNDLPANEASDTAPD